MLYPHLPAGRLNFVKDLMPLDLGVVYKRLIKEDPDGEKFGLLPHMAMSRLGAVSAESYCERVFSCANLVMDEKRTRLSDSSVEKAVLLRMNAKFMAYMRATYPHVLKEKFAMHVAS